MRIRVKLYPSSGRREVISSDDFLIVYVKSPPEKGKANKELIALLKKYFGAREVEILRGFKSRDKEVEVIF
ncbi:DUF167 domain-containing protein [Thermococci archaeon]|nr:MAG: DUF167 domain-containing protein [Thermococci archaeon]